MAFLIIKAYRASLVYCCTDENKALYKSKIPFGGSDKGVIIGGLMLEDLGTTVFWVADTVNDILAILRVWQWGCDSKVSTARSKCYTKLRYKRLYLNYYYNVGTST